MMGWQICGQYLGRIVRVAGLHYLGDFQASTLPQFSMLLLCFEEEGIPKNEFRIFLEKVVPLDPLAIVVAGNGALNYFDEVLSFLDKRKAGLQIMTNVNESLNVADWPAEFLSATWPSEERHDAWKEYAVIAIGSDKHQESVYSAFEEATD